MSQLYQIITHYMHIVFGTTVCIISSQLCKQYLTMSHISLSSDAVYTTDET